MLDEYKGKIDDILTKIDTLIVSLKETSDSARGGLESLSDVGGNLDTTLTAYRKLAENLNGQVNVLSGQMQAVLSSTKTNADQMGVSIEELSKRLQTEAADAATELKKLLADSNAMVKNADGMITENRAELNAILESLEKTMKSLESFTEQIDKRPSSLVWGRGKKKEK